MSEPTTAAGRAFAATLRPDSPYLDIIEAIEEEAVAARDRELRAAVADVVAAFEALPDEMRQVMERNGVIFDKWPPANRPAGPWTSDEIAGLDPEVRWQGIAFTFYTDWVIGPLSIVIRELAETVADSEP